MRNNDEIEADDKKRSLNKSEVTNQTLAHNTYVQYPYRWAL